MYPNHQQYGSQGPPPNQQYSPPGGPNGPPPSYYNAPAGYGPPQPQHYGYNQGYAGGPPPPQQYQQQAPYGQPQYGQGPPPQGPPPQQQHPYGQAYGQGYGYGGAPPPMMAPPSLGYDPNQTANVDTMADVEELRQSMKGFGTNEDKMIRVLARIPDPLIMANVQQTYNQRLMRNLHEDIHKETSGWFRETAQAVVRGPLHQDVWLLHNAIHGAGTKEDTLDLVLLGRPQADLDAIKREYQRQYHKPLAVAVRDDLSLKTAQLFDLVLEYPRPPDAAPVNPAAVQQATEDLHRATLGTHFGTDQVAVCRVFASHSDPQLAAISQDFHRRYKHQLEHVIDRDFSHHMKRALLRMLHIAQNKPQADAILLEHAMDGMGTKDHLLLNLVVKVHWNKQYLSNVKASYKQHYGKDLVQRVKSETSGHYEKLLVALLQ